MSELLRVEGMQVEFAGARGERLRAVRDLDLSLQAGETLGLVGESGSGKTTIGRAILQLQAMRAGRVLWCGDGGEVDLAQLRGAALRRQRQRMSLIFQDPYASLNPRMTVRDLIAEPLAVSAERLERDHIDHRVRQMADACRIPLAHLRRFPHAFSGGQRQRIGIARALVSSPAFVVCDECVSALDVSVQADIVNLLIERQAESRVSYLFISHDLSVVAAIATRVAVLYYGELVECGPVEQVYGQSAHPYTRSLIDAIPQIGKAPLVPPRRHGAPLGHRSEAGCIYAAECPLAQPRCRELAPPVQSLGEGHWVRCHLPQTAAAEATASSRRTSSAPAPASS